MGILQGSLTVRRYRAAGTVPDDFRTSYVDALNDNAFREPRDWTPGVEAIGWCQVHNLLDTDFSDLNKWLYNEYAVLAMRIDKKSLPAKLLKAHLDKKVAEWCQENHRDKCPARVRTDLKEQLEGDMLVRTLPRVAVHEFCWNIVDGTVLFHNTSEKVNDTFRKVFRETFGIALLPWSPLDFLADSPDLAATLEAQGLSDLRPDHAVGAAAPVGGEE
ncbi:MAG: recombination-associated protein RdgC [Alphaproteobacteria bacterium]|nr:recombination-associated protein RdgC [Alphaproteobacteria bacterium]